jgi:N-glycosylase/DNA lyase
MIAFQIPALDFSLSESLECGQTFRWRRLPTEGYYGWIEGSTVNIHQEGFTLTVQSLDPTLTPEPVSRYFALDLDLASILSSIDVDAQLHDAITRHRGLRVLRQDPWECLASFICSSYNNITRIQGMIERLCRAYGTSVGFNGFSGYTFPLPEAIAAASERELRALGLGFRAGYLQATARMIAEGKLALDALRDVTYAAAKTALRHCPGVGDKVADCVALFGLEQYEAFPIDLWIERAMRYYFRRQKMTPKRIHEFARRHFGVHAGYAQQ